MFLKRRLRPFYITLTLLFAPTTLWASSKDKVYYPSPRSLAPKMTAAETQAETQRRTNIANQSQYVFSLTAAEIAVNQGMDYLALNTYIDVLNKSQSPDVAERAMDLAIAYQSKNTIEEIHQLWQKIEPEGSPAFRRMSLLRAMTLGDSDFVHKNLENVLQEANEIQAQRVLLQLAQNSITTPKIAEDNSDIINKFTQKYPQLLEVHMLNALFATYAKNDNRAIAALNELAKRDEELSPLTRLALTVMVRQNPNLLDKFFVQADNAILPMLWQELAVEQLLNKKEYAKAIEQLNQMAARYPHENYYLRAAMVSYEEKNAWRKTLALLETAYKNSAKQIHQSHAATLAAISLIEHNEAQEAQKWIERVQAAEFKFDRYLLELALFVHEKQWDKAVSVYNQIQKSGLKNGDIYGQTELYQLYLPALQKSSLSDTQKLTQFNQIIAKMKNSDENIYLAAIYSRAFLYLDLKQPDKAIADFRQYVKMRPNSAQGLNALGYTLLDYPKYLDEGFELIQKAYQAEPESPEINDSMGWAYYKKGDLATALPYLQFAYTQSGGKENGSHVADDDVYFSAKQGFMPPQVKSSGSHQHQQKNDDVALNDNIGEVGAHLGEVFWKLGNQTKARQIWKDSWTKNPTNPILKQILKKYQIQFK